MRKPKSATARLGRVRAWVQGLFLLVWLDPLMLRMHFICGPVFHCYSCPLATFACPIGVMAQFGALRLFPFLAVGTLLVVGGLFGALICGWVCPFGFVQDALGKVPTPRFRLPRWTGYGRYVVLGGLVIAVPVLFGYGHPWVICSVCPVGALEGAFPRAAGAAMAGESFVLPNALKLGAVALVLIGVFFTYRPWCRTLCPLGALYGLTNRAAAVFLAVDPEKCTHCGRCTRECRYGVRPDVNPNDTRCIRCLECTSCEALSVGHPFMRRHADAQGTKAASTSDSTHVMPEAPGGE